MRASLRHAYKVTAEIHSAAATALTDIRGGGNNFFRMASFRSGLYRITLSKAPLDSYSITLEGDR
jgi:hypothetical protein